MARRSRTQLTSEHAKKIVKKLKAQRGPSSKAHDHYEVFYEDTLVVTLSLRRGSGKYLGHDHLIHDLRVNASKCKCLAQCSYSRVQWLRDIGIIVDDEQAP